MKNTSKRKQFDNTLVYLINLYSEIKHKILILNMHVFFKFDCISSRRYFRLYLCENDDNRLVTQLIHLVCTMSYKWYYTSTTSLLKFIDRF